MATWRLVAVLAAALILAACAPGAVQDASSASAPSSATRSLTVYRSPDCSCCHVWADIARREGWTVVTVDKLDMTTFKADMGIPVEAASCHTAIVDGYFVEGHVPLEAVERLLSERPDIDGIALPGMPPGSPGMAGAKQGPFEVLAIVDRVATSFGSY